VAGRCRPLAGADLGGADLAGPDLAHAGGGGDMNGDALAPLCSFNSDGTITRAEAPFIVGLGALYASTGSSSSTVPVDLQPHSGAWDYSAPASGDTKVFDQLIDPSSAWWQSYFPSATHAQHVQDGQPILGVYSAGQDSLDLLGLVSETDGTQRTLLTYQTPIPVLKFPLSVGTTWSASSYLTGQAQGIFITAYDTYAFAVDLRGTTKTPAGNFDTLRLRIDFSETINFVTTTHYIDLHLAECYGAVARLRSRDDETSRDFTQAAEYRRLSTL
jgi:hypothetical protein